MEEQLEKQRRQIEGKDAMITELAQEVERLRALARGGGPAQSPAAEGKLADLERSVQELRAENAELRRSAAAQRAALEEQQVAVSQLVAASGSRPASPRDASMPRQPSPLRRTTSNSVGALQPLSREHSSSSLSSRPPSAGTAKALELVAELRSSLQQRSEEVAALESKMRRQAERDAEGERSAEELQRMVAQQQTTINGLFEELQQKEHAMRQLEAAAAPATARQQRKASSSSLPSSPDASPLAGSAYLSPSPSPSRNTAGAWRLQQGPAATARGPDTTESRLLALLHQMSGTMVSLQRQLAKEHEVRRKLQARLEQLEPGSPLLVGLPAWVGVSPRRPSYSQQQTESTGGGGATGRRGDPYYQSIEERTWVFK